MVTWGTGNFDSDGAGDYLDSLMKQLIKTIEACLGGKYVMYPSDDDDDILGACGEDMLMPSVDILALLCEHFAMPLPVTELIIRQWKEQYLRSYDRHIDHYVTKPDFKIRRRRVIEATFDRLLGLAHDWDLVRSVD
ncbi:MAG: DUF4259 domain-containing protein [Chloroflexota bacterium]